MRPNRRDSADRMLAELEVMGWIRDPVAREAAQATEQARTAESERPVIEALREIGVEVPEVWALLDPGMRYPEAIPILLDHLARPYPAAIREGLARALGTPDARPIWHTIAARYVEEADERVKEALAVSVAATATDATVDDLLRLIAEPRHGTSRVLLLTAKFPVRALPALEALVNDPDLRLELPGVIKRLRRRSGTATERVGSPPSPIDPTLAEASTSVDLESVARLLSRVVRFSVGFTRSHAATVRRLVDELELDEEREVRFDIAIAGARSPLVVRAHLDDPHTVDLYFFGPASIADRVQSALEQAS